MTPRPADIQSPILHPPVAAKNFEIKPALVTMIQSNALFNGHESESPREHVHRFLELAKSLKINGVTAEALQLRFFPYSLSGKALRWLNNRPPRAITSWDDLFNKFMARYCPPSKTAEWRKKITHFEQEEDETLRDARERYSEYFLQCPRHGFEEQFRIKTFYGGLMQEDKFIIDSLCQGKLMNMAPPQITEILEDMELRGYDWGLTRSGRRSNERGVRSVGASAPLEAKLDKLLKVMLEDKRQGKRAVMSCDWCSSTSHEIAECQAMKEATTPEEQINYVANARVNNPYSNTYYRGWRNHPNFDWASPVNPRPSSFQGPTGNFQPRPTFIQQRPQLQGSNFQQPYQPQGALGFQQQHQPDKLSKLEELMNTFVSTISQKFEKIEQFMDVATTKFTSVEAGLRSHQASLQSLEVQIGNLAGVLTKRPKGALPSQTMVNPKDQVGVNALQVRSVKVVPEVSTGEEMEKEETTPIRREKKPSMNERKAASKALPKDGYLPPLPYPTRMYKERLDNECGGFMEMLHNLHLNVPFLEAMAQMPRYAKYLKGFLINKPRLEGLANATLGEECSSFLLDRLPKKHSDPGSFTIPLDIGDHHIDNALADLGASVNVMSYKLFKNLEVGDLKTSKLSITLANRSVISSRDIVEDMMVRVGKFCYPTDFVIFGISEDSDMPLILIRPFLATAKASIDVNEGTLILRDGKERIKLEIDPRVRSDEVKGVVSNDVNESGGEPPKANPTIT
ncbi:unnamed protein product [Linum trigynum]|uniref:Retrotransposon gag domain-containing protein n=1 Tax=Linum trigynum TaxID=586398 RepID=A0AAV2CIL3_9ROSI